MREDILKKRYYRKDADGRPMEDWPALCKRVAKAVALDEAEERQFFEAMVYGYFLPNTPALTNAGRQDFTLSACFVPKLSNGIENILDAIRTMALIQKMGGGTGFCFDDPGLPAQLPESYRPVFLISREHPDAALVERTVLDHTEVRTVGSEANFTDIHVVRDDMAHIFSFEALLEKPGFIGFSSLRPRGARVSSTGGEASGPASFMEVWDRVTGYLKNPIGPCSTVRVFNACTEAIKQGSTRRGANMGVLRADHPDIMEFVSLKERDGELPNFNLSVAVTDTFMTAVRDDGPWELRDGNGQIVNVIKAKDLWKRIIHAAWLNGGSGALFIDAINRANPTPLAGRFRTTNPCGEQPLLENEACVLGSINLSAMVGKRGIDRDRLKQTVRMAVTFLDNAVDLQSYPTADTAAMHKANRKIGLGVMGWADALIRLEMCYACQEAVDLAEEVMRFITENAVEVSKERAERLGVFPNWEGSVWAEKGIKVRNATLTTIAPTGSISIIAECSGGIEPNFAWETTRRQGDGEFVVSHPLYAAWREENDGEPLPGYFVTAHEVPVEWHIRMQAAFQKHVHNAVSKTINLPADAAEEEVARAYELAWRTGCKGITVYRDGSMKNQVLQKTGKGKPAKVKIPEVHPIDLPKVRDQKLVEIPTPEGAIFVHITLVEGRPMEVFITTPTESRHDESYAVSARLLSTGLRCGIPVRRLLKQLEEANKKYGSVVSPNGAIIRAFRMLGLSCDQETCPDCGGALVLQEGCLKCISCGYSRC